jgi:4'-phosphopantetheinyl transferase
MADHTAEYRVRGIAASAGPVPKAKRCGEALSVSRALLTQDPALICGAQSALRVAARSVHVWAFNLKASGACLDECRQTLCRIERSRADRFVHAASRDDFVVAHGVLRHLLGRYTGKEARDLRFSSGPNGKPTLEAPGSEHRVVSFNMTHSQGRALIAVSDGREVGIDLEKIKPDVKALAIAQRYFASAELAAIEGAPAPLQAGTFFRYWVAKEALLKGQGVGLRFPIDEFEVQFDARDLSARVRIREPSRLSGDWTVQILPVEAGWAGALAVRGSNWTLKLENPQPTPSA